MEQIPRGTPGVRARRLNRRWRKQRAYLGLLTLPFIAVAVLPSSAQALALLPAPTPSPAAQGNGGPCLLGVLLCGNNIVQNPAPCLLGLLCNPAPLPTPCIGNVLLCQGNGILTNGTQPTPTPGVPGPNAAGGGAPGTNPGQATTAGGGTAGVPAAGVASLPAPPGVGIVGIAPFASSPAVAGPSPDPLAVLLSLSIRDGLTVGSYSIWPWLAGMQLALLLVIVAMVCSRQLTAASKPTS